jgi:hypothetical protein
VSGLDRNEVTNLVPGRPILLLLSLGLLLGALAPAPGFAAAAPKAAFQTVLPSWQKGMAWTVQAQYQVMSGGVPGPRSQEATWSTPVTWRFKVMERVTDRNLEIFRIKAEQLGSSGGGVAGLLFLGERQPDGGLRSLALVRAAYRDPARSGELESLDYTRRATGPFPVINELSLVPGDFPMFGPAGVVRQSELVEHFEVTEQQGTAFFARDLVQRLEPVELQPGDDRVKVPLAASARVLECTVTRASDRNGFQQLWTPTAPWFLYSENGSMKAWLVDVK